MAIAYFFAWRELDFNLFKTECFQVFDTIMRAICALLLQIKLNKELKNSFRVLTWLKYQKVTPKNSTSRYISLIISFMQCTAPIVT